MMVDGNSTLGEIHRAILAIEAEAHKTGRDDARLALGEKPLFQAAADSLRSVEPAAAEPHAWGLLNRWLSWAKPIEALSRESWQRLVKETEDYLERAAQPPRGSLPDPDVVATIARAMRDAERHPDRSPAEHVLYVLSNAGFTVTKR